MESLYSFKYFDEGENMLQNVFQLKTLMHLKQEKQRKKIQHVKLHKTVKKKTGNENMYFMQKSQDTFKEARNFSGNTVNVKMPLEYCHFYNFLNFTLNLHSYCKD